MILTNIISKRSLLELFLTRCCRACLHLLRSYRTGSLVFYILIKLAIIYLYLMHFPVSLGTN